MIKGMQDYFDDTKKRKLSVQIPASHFKAMNTEGVKTPLFGIDIEDLDKKEAEKSHGLKRKFQSSKTQPIRV